MKNYPGKKKLLSNYSSLKMTHQNTCSIWENYMRIVGNHCRGMIHPLSNTEIKTPIFFNRWNIKNYGKNRNLGKRIPEAKEVRVSPPIISPRSRRKRWDWQALAFLIEKHNLSLLVQGVRSDFVKDRRWFLEHYTTASQCSWRIGMAMAPGRVELYSYLYLFLKIIFISVFIFIGIKN